MSRLSDKRERLIDAARTLFHQQGFGSTTLADIAQHSGVPLGNVYYYFKTKEEIAAAVADLLGSGFLDYTAELAQRYGDPAARLIAFLDGMAGRNQEFKEHGCPVGTLCQELARTKQAPSARADAVLKLELGWIAAQLAEMGRPDADDLAVQLLSRLQGAMLLASALDDGALLCNEIGRCRSWIQSFSVPQTS